MTPTTTIQDRLRWILDARKITKTELSRRAGLNKNHIAGTLADPKRRGFKGDVLYKIAYAAQVDLSWLANGVGRPDGPGVPIEPPPIDPDSEGNAQANEDRAGWKSVALAAIELEKGRLDWAVTGVGELPAKPGVELTPYYVLHEAEKLEKAVRGDLDERARLDKKLRQFMKAHAPVHKSASKEAESGHQPASPRKK